MLHASSPGTVSYQDRGSAGLAADRPACRVSGVAEPTSIPSDGRGERWGVLDALRGFALCGILFVNLPDLLGLSIKTEGTSNPHIVAVLRYGVQTRFVPIFTVLFGASLVFVVRGARARGRSAAAAVLCRLAALFVIGVLHRFLYLGEILSEYAVIGLLVLPAVLFLPRWGQLVIGATLTAGVYAVAGGGLLSEPGLMLLGAAAAAYDLPAVLDRGSRRTPVVFVGASVLLLPALWWQTTEPGDPRFGLAGGVAGGVMALWYVTGFALLWRTRARVVLAAAFEPIGRMALTNYVGASVIVVLGIVVLQPATAAVTATVVVAAAVVLVGQSLVSRLWLTWFRYGPLEWLWRMATWRRPIRLRRSSTALLTQASTVGGSPSER